jgi:hypothetical protein
MGPTLTTLTVRRAALVAAALVAFPLAGCLGKGATQTRTDNPAAPQGPAAGQSFKVGKGRLVSAWENRVILSPDVNHGGATVPTLSGRVYLFNEDLKSSFLGDGGLVIDLFDTTPQAAGGQPKLLEHVIIDPGSLKQFSKKDVFGAGYSIFFPWGTYSPDVKQIYLVLRYDNSNGESLFHQSGTLVVDHSLIKEMEVKKAQMVAGARNRQMIDLKLPSN